MAHSLKWEEGLLRLLPSASSTLEANADSFILSMGRVTQRTSLAFYWLRAAKVNQQPRWRVHRCLSWKDVSPFLEMCLNFKYISLHPYNKCYCITKCFINQNICKSRIKHLTMYQEIWGNPRHSYCKPKCQPKMPLIQLSHFPPRHTWLLWVTDGCSGKWMWEISCWPEGLQWHVQESSIISSFDEVSSFSRWQASKAHRVILTFLEI